MVRSVLWHLKLMLRQKNFQFAFTFMMILSVGSTLFYAAHNSNYDKTSGVSGTFAYIFCDSYPLMPLLGYILPVVMILPFSMNHFKNKRLGSPCIFITRLSRKKYYISQAICSFIGAFTIIFIPLLINILLNNLFFTDTRNDYSYSDFINFYYQMNPQYLSVSTKYPIVIPFFREFIYHPIAYTIVNSAALAVFLGVCAVFSYSLSFFVKKFGILIAVPFEAIFFIGLSQKLNYDIFAQDDFINFDLLDYFTIGGVTGRVYLIPVIFCIALLIASAVIIHIKIKKDQFD